MSTTFEEPVVIINPAASDCLSMEMSGAITGGIRLAQTGGAGSPAFTMVGDRDVSQMNVQIRGDVYTGSSASAGHIVFGRSARGSLSSPSATQNGDLLLQLVGTGHSGSAFFVNTAIVRMAATQNFSGSVTGTKIELLATPNGSVAPSIVMTLQTGVQVGSPTGGDKGAGTINVSGDIYKNGTAYNNPDYVFEQYFEGTNAAAYPGVMPLDQLETSLRQAHRLPGINDEPTGIFARQDMLLEKLEEAYLYIVELTSRVKRLETQRPDENTQ